MAKLINGKEISAEIRSELKENVRAFTERTGVTPGLAVIIVGEDPASKVYVRNKHKGCLEVGMYSAMYELPENTDEKALLALIDELNRDSRIHGILCQLPLPKHLDEKKVINAIAPEKDVDVFHPTNVGRLMIGDYTLAPCTPQGHGAAPPRGDSGQREGMRGGRSVQHRRKAGRHDAFAAERHGNGLPFPDGGSSVGLPSGGYPRVGCGQGEIHHRRHGEARRRRH